MMLSQYDAMQIRIGEPLPPGANSVVPHENVKSNDNKTIYMLKPAIPDQNIK
jgi:molybdopterin biosynthesis enzyme